MKERNLARLRDASSGLLRAIGRDEAKALEVLPFVQTVTQKLMSIYVPNQLFPKGQMDIPELSALPSRETMDERSRIAKRLFGFNPKDNYVVKEISRRFGGLIKHGELVGIAAAIAERANLRLDRDAKRRKNVLIRWFDENWETIEPFLDYVVLEEVPEEDEAESNDEEAETQPPKEIPPPPQAVPTLQPLPCIPKIEEQFSRNARIVKPLPSSQP